MRSNNRADARSEEHTSELQSHVNLVCRLLLEKKNGDGVGPDRRPVRADRRHPQRNLYFYNESAPTEIYTLSLHDALPIWSRKYCFWIRRASTGSQLSRRPT